MAKSKTPGKVQWNTDLPDALAEKLASWLKTKSIFKTRAAEMGAKLLLWSPEALRDRLAEDDEAGVREWFERATQALMESELQKQRGDILGASAGKRRGSRRRGGGKGSAA